MTAVDDVLPARRPDARLIVVVVAVLAAGALWAALHLRGSYFLYDEWSMIERVSHRSVWSGMTASFNGHLWMAQYWVYRVQVSAFGVDSHAFVCGVFVVSLVLLHAAVAAVLRAARLRVLDVVLLGGLLTYLGASSQNMLFAVQVSPTLSAAAGFGAVALTLGGPSSLREPSWRRAAAVGTLLLACVAVDSGVALGLVVCCAIVAGGLWRSLRVAALAPAVLLLAGWYAFGDLGPRFPASVGARAAFARRLLLQSAGSVVGGGQIVGAVLLLASAIVLGQGARRRHVHGPVAVLAIGGVVAALVTTVGIAQSRAGLKGFTFVDFNRYLSNVALPLYVGLVPAVAVAVRAWWHSRERPGGSVLVALPAVCVAVAFALGLSPLWHYARGFTAWNRSVHMKVQAATVVIRDGCPSGAAPVPASQPAGVLSPQISTALLRELLQRGALHAPTGPAFDPNVTIAMCPDG